MQLTMSRLNAGSEVWCEKDMYPRLLTEMVGGIAEQRCACFEQRGWSNLRNVYPGCSPDAHRCKLIVKQPKSAEGAARTISTATVCLLDLSDSRTLRAFLD